MTENRLTVAGIYIARENGAGLEEKNTATALGGQGLEGDRYCRLVGDDNKNAITLISASAADVCRQRLGRSFDAAWFRRNIIVDGGDINHLVEHKFMLGEALIQGYELCHPCRYLAELLDADLLEGLKNVGGVRARIIKSGIIRVGDEIKVIA